MKGNKMKNQAIIKTVLSHQNPKAGKICRIKNALKNPNLSDGVKKTAYFILGIA